MVFDGFGVSKGQGLESYKSNGEFIAHTIFGGYPALYFIEHDEVICSSCANEYKEEVIAAFLHYEGQPICCYYCNAMLDSAYGDPEEDVNGLAVRYSGPYFRCCNDERYYRPGDHCYTCEKEIKAQ